MTQEKLVVEECTKLNLQYSMFDNSYSTMSQSTNPKTVERFTNPKVDTIKNIHYRIVDLQNEAFQQMR